MVSANFNESTRHGKNSLTSTDHIFTSFLSAQCKIKYPGLSSHTIQFITIPSDIKTNNNYKAFKRK